MENQPENNLNYFLGVDPASAERRALVSDDNNNFVNNLIYIVFYWGIGVFCMGSLYIQYRRKMAEDRVMDGDDIESEYSDDDVSKDDSSIADESSVQSTDSMRDKYRRQQKEMGGRTAPQKNWQRRKQELAQYRAKSRDLQAREKAVEAKELHLDGVEKQISRKLEDLDKKDKSKDGHGINL